MSDRHRRFKQHNLTRALRGAEGAGLDVLRIEIDIDGKIVLVTRKASETTEQGTALDRWMAEHARQA